MYDIYMRQAYLMRHIKSRNRRKKTNYYLSQKAIYRYQKKLMFLFPTIFKELKKCNYFVYNYKSKIVNVPRIFSFRTNFDESIIFFKHLLSSFLYGGHLRINFENCIELDIGCFLLLYESLSEFQNLEIKYNTGLPNALSTKKKILITPSTNDKVNKYIHAFDLSDLSDWFATRKSKDKYLALPLKKGKQRIGYGENRKNIVCKEIVKFIEDSYYGTIVLSTKGRNLIERFVSEVLCNAEDHSINHEWFVLGVSFLEYNKQDEVAEVNLAIMNIGNSMYEGFEKNKKINIKNYKEVDSIYTELNKKNSILKKFNRESLFTLLILNEGMSRLKFERESRGQGTMQFIDAFLKLGDYGTVNPQFRPELNIISGHTILKCDDKYKPFVENNLQLISLNKENDIYELPDDKYLIFHNEYFPGTIIEFKIYLNQKYLERIVQE